jgi:hypothetical protein
MDILFVQTNSSKATFQSLVKYSAIELPIWAALLANSMRSLGVRVDILDWNKWWFYEDEQVEYGGLAEWICLQARDPWGNGEHDPGHPSLSSHKKFCERVILPILENKV